jgi:hypothetical protein
MALRCAINKLIAFFLFMMLGTGILLGIMAGGGGIVTTDLTANVTANQTYLPVLSTLDFYTPDYVIIGKEKIYYTSLNDTDFLSCTRGYGNTTAASHLAGARVYTAQSAAMNNAVGFNILAIQDDWGWASFIAVPILFIVATLPHIIKDGANLITGDLAIIMWFYYAMVGAFIITLAWTVFVGRRVG